MHSQNFILVVQCKTKKAYLEVDYWRLLLIGVYRHFLIDRTAPFYLHPLNGLECACHEIQQWNQESMTTKLPSTKIWVKHLWYDCVSTFNYIWSMNGNLYQYIINIKVSIFPSCHYQMINTVIFNKHTRDIPLVDKCLHMTQPS